MTTNTRFLATTVFTGLLAAMSGMPAHAGTYVGPSTNPFAFVNNGFGIPGGPVVCFATFCAGNNLSHNFIEVNTDFNYVDPVNSDPNNSNNATNHDAELLQTTATFSGDMFTNTTGLPGPQGVPGTFLGSYSVSGQPVTFEYFGRSSDTTGHWYALMTEDNLNVNANGHSFSLTLSGPAAGFLDIQPDGFQQLGDFFLPEYAITTEFDSVPGLFTVDNGPQFPFTFGINESSNTPEPGTVALMMAPIAGLFLLKRRAKRQVHQDHRD